jgi:hypothetical protein
MEASAKAFHCNPGNVGFPTKLPGVNSFFFLVARKEGFFYYGDGAVAHFDFSVTDYNLVVVVMRNLRGGSCRSLCAPVDTAHDSLDGDLIIDGPRDPTSGLLAVNIDGRTLPSTARQATSDQQASNAYTRQPKHSRVHYLHITCGSLVKSTWCKALTAGHFTT